LHPSIKLLSSLFLLACLITLLFAPINPVSADDEQPTLAFSTYLGGDGNEFGEDIAVDDDGNIYVVGSTSSTNFPATDPFNAPTSATYGSMYVTKFDPTGTTQLYSIFLGSGTPFSIAVDDDGAAYIVGRADNIPTVNAIQATNGGGQDAFVAKVNPTGTALVYSTYLGGNGLDLALGVALDANRNVYIAGATGSSNFPTRNPFQASYGGGQWDVFVARLNAAGTALVYSTYFGGSGWDINMSIAVDNTGNAYITGDTGSDDFPTLNAYQPNHANWCNNTPYQSICTDTYVAKFSPSGTPIYSTHIGGDGHERGTGIAVDSLGSVYVAGYTNSSDFPTINAYQPTLPYIFSTFLTKFSPDGSELVYSTYLGGTNGGTQALDMAIDSLNRAFVIGVTEATDFPTAVPIQPALAGTTSNSDLFVTQFSADGQTLEFSTYFGGSLNDGIVEFSPRIAVDRRGSVYFTSSTYSNDFPLKDAFQSDPGGSSPGYFPNNFDAVVVKIAFPHQSFPDEAAARNYFTTHTPTLTWKPITWALGYRVQVNKSETFDLPYDFQGDVLASADSITTDNLDNGFYYWRILAQKPDGSWGNVSPIDSFTIDAD
jgi:hypothetical protein